MLWVGIGGHRSLLMVMVWVWVQIQRKMLGYGYDNFHNVSSTNAHNYS